VLGLWKLALFARHPGRDPRSTRATRFRYPGGGSAENIGDAHRFDRGD
jgi:hypothetical protein